ncbi:MAG: ribosome hibernation-promoting factor, HPF/YfiA family [Phycisphaerales bacterium]|nr:ribosome-associated translation inhibitor RaiA [bacterium]
MTDFTADHTTETTFQVNSRGMTTTPAIEDHIRAQIHQHLERFLKRLTRIEVHLSDENEPHRDTGDDKRCLIEARPAGRDPLVAEHTCGDMYEAIDSAVSKLVRVLEHKLERD